METDMVWPVNHMVSPKSQTVQCNECHARRNSRLAGLKDFYLPGRDYNATIDGIGSVAIILSLVGVATHAALRMFTWRRRKERAHS